MMMNDDLLKKKAEKLSQLPLFPYLLIPAIVPPPAPFLPALGSYPTTICVRISSIRIFECDWHLTDNQFIVHSAIFFYFIRPTSCFWDNWRCILFRFKIFETTSPKSTLTVSFEQSYDYISSRLHFSQKYRRW